MRILLAGYNVDVDALKDLKEEGIGGDSLTPETISAAYARISRFPQPIDELRKKARGEVERARRSNKAIIFEMGHHSIAEHAVFNFDVIDVSRLALEEIEKFRLCSYTEKSQRYVTLQGDFLIPEEIHKSGFTDDFKRVIARQNDLYKTLFKNLREYVFQSHPDLAKDRKNLSTLEGWAKEDARYILSLATLAQVGHTINARNLELLLRRFASHELAEVREVGKNMYKLVEGVAPSIILFTEANDYDGKTYPALRELSMRLGIGRKGEWEKRRNGETENGEEERGSADDSVRLVDYTPDADEITVSALLHQSCDLSFEECRERVKELSPDEKKEVIKTSCRYLELYDSALREFEYVNLTFSLIVSAACFGQLKRHRMSTISSQEYNPDLGVLIPQSIQEIGMEKEFQEVIEETDNLYFRLRERLPAASQYILTNAHQRRVLLRANARELYHISRLREDPHAQWDIRELSRKMRALAGEVMPLTMMFCCGKDKYPEVYEGIFNKPPKVTSVPG